MSKTKESEMKELEVKQTSAVAPELEMDQDIFALLPRAESSDFDIPRITLIQPTSRIEGTAGDLVCSDSGDKVSVMNEKFEFIPVWFFKDYSISEVETDKFRRNEIKSADNAMYSVFDNRVGRDPDGVAVKRDERLNLFVIKASGLDDDFPRLYRVIIKPSSFKEAKKFLSEWEIQIRSRLIPFSYYWTMTPKEVRNEKGKFAILEFQKVLDGKRQKQVTKEQLPAISNWVKMLTANQHVITKDTVPDEAAAEDNGSGIPF